MTEQWDDTRLLAELREALRSAGPVPDRVLRSGEAAFTWRTVDEELEMALLSYDSRQDRELVVRSSAETSHLLVYETAALQLQLEVSGASLVGQVVPPGPGTVTVRTASGATRSVTADDLGCFTLELPEGPVRLTCRTAAGSLTTGWLSS